MAIGTPPLPADTVLAPVSALAAGTAVRRRGVIARMPLSGKISGGLLVALVAMALLAPVLPLANPIDNSLTERLLPPFSESHLLGTDTFGRDMLSRLVWGSRPALLGGVTPVLLGGILGTIIGVAAGMARPGFESFNMRVLDVLFAFPALLLAIIIAATIGGGLETIIFAITLIVIPPIARMANSETSRIRDRDYVTVARASGASAIAIGLRQIVPNIAPTIIVYATSLVGLSIVYASGLAFLGLGVLPPEADWGAMVSELRNLLFTAPALAVMPALVIFAVSIAFNVLGDGLRDALVVEGEHS